MKCPYCAEEIQDEAIKCRFCHESLDGSRPEKPKWYFTTPIIVLALLSVGPFALPLIWLHPSDRKSTKILLTVVILALSVWFYFIARDLLRTLGEQRDELGM